MCGRFTLTTPEEVLADVFGLEAVPRLEARYNIAPTQAVAAVGRRDPQQRPRLSRLHWGFSRPAPGTRRARLLINARAETAHRLPAFREALRLRRCLLPADGFYEWQGRQPMYIHRRDRRPFALAGLWEARPGADPPAACVILTTAPNALLRPIHDRMPVILPPSTYARWLDPERTEPEELRDLLVPCPPDEWSATAVGPRVNDARYDGPACLEPA